MLNCERIIDAQVHIIELWMHMYEGGVSIFDEIVETAKSITNGVTIRKPATTLRVLGKLCEATRVVAMDADFLGDEHGDTLLRGILPLQAPMLWPPGLLTYQGWLNKPAANEE